MAAGLIVLTGGCSFHPTRWCRDSTTATVPLWLRRRRRVRDGERTIAAAGFPRIRACGGRGMSFAAPRTSAVQDLLNH
jgi:hypothetical protein